MEWYLWLLIGYASWVFLTVLISLFTSRNYGFWYSIFIFVVAFLYGLIVSPFLWLISLYRYLRYDKPSYKTCTIHELTEDNKTTLRQLGFQEGSFVSNNNLDYDGFRYNKGEIYVLYNGRIGVKYLRMTSTTQNHLFKIIKALPKNETKEEVIKEEVAKPKRTYVRKVKVEEKNVD